MYIYNQRNANTPSLAGWGENTIPHSSDFTGFLSGPIPRDRPRDPWHRHPMDSQPPDIPVVRPSPTPQFMDCRGWESDPQSFSKVAAEHYARTQLQVSSRVRDIACTPDNRMCHVYFENGLTVIVSFAQIPNYVIVRRAGREGPRCEYDYRCTYQGSVIFTLRRCEPR